MNFQGTVHHFFSFTNLRDQLSRNRFHYSVFIAFLQDEREEKSPSYFNAAEVIHVLDYVKMVLNMKKNPVSLCWDG